ncbi:MAG: HD-GYP domain-containing protein [Rubripirellula sp.]
MQGVDFIPISVSTLLPAEAIGLDLFQKQAETPRMILYRGADYPLTMSDLDRLRGRGVSQLFIAKDSRALYQRYLRRVAVSGDPTSVPLSTRAGALSEVVRDVLQAAFSRDHLDQTVRAAGQIGSLTAEILTNTEFAATDMLRVLHHDYATFTHSANVAFFCGMLATELGLPREDVENISTGGLLHDLGKLEIREDLLQKPARLSEAEFRVIRMHPILGFKKLAHRDDLLEGHLMMTYQHHERLDGKGYPVGCVDNEIHLWAKICAVVDVFEALTSHRPYRTPMPRSKALKLMKRDSGTAFDPEILACWESIIRRNLAK